MVSKPHSLTYSDSPLGAALRQQAFGSQDLSRLFPILYLLRYSETLNRPRTLEFHREPEEVKEFVALIFISYMDQERRSASGHLMDTGLRSVRNDLRLLLDYFHYRHDNTSRRWFFVMDFDLEYTDWTGVTKVLPRTMPDKDALLRAVRVATGKGGSGFIHVGANCVYDCDGPCHVRLDGQTVIGPRAPKVACVAPKVAYIVSSDGQQISGTEFYSCLSDDYDVGLDATITLSFDMSHAGAFFKDVVNLSPLETTAPSATSQATAPRRRRSQKQLVVIYSTQADQAAGSIYDGRILFGAVSSLMIEYLKEHPLDSVTEVFEYLNAVCNTRPQEHLRQSPFIASRYPIHGPLRLLPGSKRFRGRIRQQMTKQEPSSRDSLEGGSARAGHSAKSKGESPPVGRDPETDLEALVGFISPVACSVIGRFSDVFEGMHKIIGKIALKRPRVSRDEDIVRRFEREAATWRRLQHRHVLEFLGTMKRDGHVYLASPFVEDGTLMEYIAREPKVNKILLLCQTADAINYLHSEDVVHGDIKAANILISKGGYALLCDFGLSKMIDARTSTCMKGAGSVRWMSPELWDNAPRSFMSDVYAFGMTIAEVLSGKEPFPHLLDSVAVIVAVMSHGERPLRHPPSSLDGLPYGGAWDLAEACWQTKPSDRISMMEAFERLSMLLPKRREI